MHHIHVAYCYKLHTAWSVCVSGIPVSPPKWVNQSTCQTHVGTRDQVLDRSAIGDT